MLQTAMAACPFGANRVPDFEPSSTDDPKALYKEFNELRQKCPAAWSNENGGFWMLTRYEDVKSAALDTQTFISSVKAVVPSDPRGVRRPPLNTDPPAHTPYRRALDRTLKASRLNRLRPILQAHAEREFSRLAQRGSGNVATEFGAMYAAWVEVTWLNLSEEVAPQLATTSAAWVNAWREQNKDETVVHSNRLYKIATALFQDRRECPRDPEQDPASSLLLEHGPDGQPLSDELLIGALRQSLVVGMVAPPIFFGSICAHLAEDRALQQQLRQDPSLIPAAVEEFIRLYVPYRGFCRTPTRDIEIEGRAILVGEPVTMTYAAANRDPNVFEEPDEFILGRKNITSHLGFGYGRHRCAGMPLARMALQEGVRAILKLTTDFKVDGPFEYARMPEMGIISCPLKIVTA
jgi:cytochrome P450